MIDKVIRLFNIINAIQANPGISAADLAFKCDTLHRDIDDLSLFAPITNLVGYCHLKQGIRTFRISRFQQVEVTGELFDKGDFNIKQ